MIRTLAIANYRSLRDLVIPLGQLTVITGNNGSGKSNVYRSLRLLSETAIGGAVPSLAREGGLDSALWAGPDVFSRDVKAGRQQPQGTRSGKPISIRLGFATDDLGYAVDFGIPKPLPYPSAFTRDPEIKREIIWHGDRFRKNNALADRRAGNVRARDDRGTWTAHATTLTTYDSMLTAAADPRTAPEVLLLRDRIRSWRFYDSFRTDHSAPARQGSIGTRTPILHHDGRDLAAAIQTIIEVGDHDGLAAAVEDAFAGAQLTVNFDSSRLVIAFKQHGLLRPLSQAELSDGTLRYLLLVAALLTPRPPELMVLNEPETSLHPDLLPSLARLITRASDISQLWVVTHSADLTEMLSEHSTCQPVHLVKELGETHVEGQDLLSTPNWSWPPR